LERAQIVVNLAGHNLGVAAKLDKALWATSSNFPH